MATPTKVVFFSSKPYDTTFFNKEKIEAYSDEQFSFRYIECNLNPDSVKMIEMGETAICVFVNDIVNRTVIEVLAEKGIKIIALRCAGFNNVDLEAAKEYNIQVCRVPAYSPECVAEHAMAMVLTLNRKTHKAYNRVREQNFGLNGLLGFNLHNRTIGVIGTGKIGKCFINAVRGFGVRILAYDVFPDASLKDQGVELVDLDTIYKESDVISLHCPLFPNSNYHLINDETIAKMKDGVMIINTSRGGLIDTSAVIRGLKSRKIGYLGIDVYEQEENIFFRDLSGSIIEDDTIQRLMSFPNVLVTAHQAFFTEEALEQISSVTLNNINTIATTGTADKTVLL